MTSKGGGAFSWVPYELLLIIMAKLPAFTLLRMRAVCKEWNKILSPANAIRTIHQNAPIVHYPAYFIQLPWTRGGILGNEYPIDDMQSWVIEPATGAVHKVPMPNFVNMDLAMRRWGNLVIDACKSIYCCSRQERDRGVTLSLCNPGTNTWRCLPYHEVVRWNFTGMAFDPSTGHCTLLIGHNGINRITIDSYDSESNVWSVIDMDLRIGITPIRDR
ncbi:hypothetical protein KI387_043674, partial [Taxus chinensis]